jgi:hypothetical protein
MLTSTSGLNLLDAEARQYFSGQCPPSFGLDSPRLTSPLLLVSCEWWNHDRPTTSGIDWHIATRILGRPLLVQTPLPSPSWLAVSHVTSHVTAHLDTSIV